ncbi:hypothetical protein [Sediminimonas sp.]|uniref:hypothetical protein n=1 Tax=Sediminimonas sp. TaxID=2823379 RepID=UPI0025E2C465|nr:hypothetical protein [Sediminimonas sp.]
MYFTRIDMPEFALPAQPGAALAGVGRGISGGCVHLHCTARSTDRTARCEALVNDALRQLQRMPEFRRGGHDITLAPGLRRRGDMARA